MSHIGHSLFIWSVICYRNLDFYFSIFYGHVFMNISLRLFSWLEIIKLKSWICLIIWNVLMSTYFLIEWAKCIYFCKKIKFSKFGGSKLVFGTGFLSLMHTYIHTHLSSAIVFSLVFHSSSSKLLVHAFLNYNTVWLQFSAYVLDFLAVKTLDQTWCLGSATALTLGSYII